MDAMLKIVIVADCGGQPFVFVVKRFGEKEFHLPRRVLEHDSLVSVSTDDFLEDVFLRGGSGPFRVCFAPNVTDRGLPVRATVVHFRDREEPMCKKEAGIWEWVSVEAVLKGHGELRLEANSRTVISQVFAAVAEGMTAVTAGEPAVTQSAR